MAEKFNITLKPVTTRVRKVNGELYYEKRENECFISSSKVMERNGSLEGSRYYELSHVKQTEKWDCGLCCLSMVLSSLERSDSDLDSLKKLHLGTVVWTVSLAYLFKSYNLPVKFFTISAKISANYETDIFSLQQDAPEINTFHQALVLAQSRVEQANQNGIFIEERELSNDELKEYILKDYVALVLINSLFFDCMECNPIMFNEDRYLSMPLTGSPYRGHYILICGYNPRSNTYVYKNPSSDKTICFIPASLLDKSRKSYGTQHNIILIDLSHENIEHRQRIFT